MSLQNKIKERIGASPEETPKLPEIKNDDTRKAQADLNLLLRRDDIISNAVPSNEGKILTIFIHGYLASTHILDPLVG
ncbi:MAG: hypothetical protein ACTSSB_03650 [Candidatus Heimdallarchaeota archaeon]